MEVEKKPNIIYLSSTRFTDYMNHRSLFKFLNEFGPIFSTNPHKFDVFPRQFLVLAFVGLFDVCKWSELSCLYKLKDHGQNTHKLCFLE